MSNLVPTMTALDRLKRTTQRSSLDELVTAKTKRTLLLVDVSYSMSWVTKARPEDAGERKIDALRKVVYKLRSSHPVPMAAFGLSGRPQVALIESEIPEPQGNNTPMDEAIEFGRMQEANHLILVTDGLPDSKSAAFSAAGRFGHPIDVFFIGNEADQGAEFCIELARRTKGQSGVTNLAGDGEQKKVTGRIIALIGDGSEVL
jgi:hypothetical protein